LSRFVAITVVLVAALGWLSWRLLDQDRALERQRTRDRLESAADLVAAELLRGIAEIGDTLGFLVATGNTAEAERRGAALPTDALLLLASSDRLNAYPRGRLLHTPLAATQPEPAPAIFARGDSLEFRARNPAAASDFYEAMARSRDVSVRAAALLRLGRTTRKANRVHLAAAAYAQMAGLGDALVNGIPAALLARAGRLTLWRETGDSTSLQREALELHDALHSGRWRMPRSAFEFYDAEVSRVLSLPPAPHGDAHLAARMAATEAAAAFWTSWREDDGERPDAKGWRAVNVNDHPLLIAWGTRGDRIAAIVGGREFVATLMSGVAPLLARQHAALSLSDEQSRPVLTVGVANASAVRVSRSRSETRLPWTLQIASASSASGTGVAERRRLLIAGMAVAGLLALFGTYAVTRAATREMDAVRMQADFVSAVSHEFRTPLTSLLQLTELLASGRVSSADRRAQYYGALKRETERLHRFVESLLAFGRADAGVAERRGEPFEGVALARDTVAEFARDVAASGFTVELSAPNESLRMTGDQEALKRALWNLLDNAVKYSTDTSRVEVDVSRHSDRLAIAVRDHGLGIPVHEQAAIFEKFRRGQAARDRGIRGTGIGLALVKQIVEAHGGTVGVHSATGSGGGSTFTIELPLRPHPTAVSS